ncbi:hypothetical protein LINPERHAP1_LOCUS17672, partial [Linum perenne]
MEVGKCRYFKIARCDNRADNVWDINTATEHYKRQLRTTRSAQSKFARCKRQHIRYSKLYGLPNIFFLRGHHRVLGTLE